MTEETKTIKRLLDEKINMIAIFYGTLKELYGDEIAQLVMQRVNAKVKALEDLPSSEGKENV